MVRGENTRVAGDFFVGRRDELTRFSALLMAMTTRESSGISRWLGHRRSPGYKESDARSRVVLVHGLGGSGKSQLLRHFRAMAHGSAPGWPVLPGPARTVWLDWEDERRDDPGSYVGLAGPSLLTVLDAVQKAVTGADGGGSRAAEQAGRAFADYRQGAAQMPEYAARFADVLAQARESGSPFIGEDAAALIRAAASAALVVGGHPGPPREIWRPLLAEYDYATSASC